MYEKLTTNNLFMTFVKQLIISSFTFRWLRSETVFRIKLLRD